MSDANVAMNPAATGPLPWFMPAPGATDWLYIITVAFLILLIFGVGVFYLKLHALPERLSHGASKMQLQIVGVLALIALFTHNHVFWIAALLLALVEFPDFSTPLNSISRSLEKLSGNGPPPAVADTQAVPEVADAAATVREPTSGA